MRVSASSALLDIWFTWVRYVLMIEATGICLSADGTRFLYDENKVGFKHFAETAEAVLVATAGTEVSS